MLQSSSPCIGDRKNKRKLIICLFCLFICFTLPGGAVTGLLDLKSNWEQLKQDIESKQEDSQGNALKDRIAENAALVQEKSTYDAGKKAMAKADEASIRADIAAKYGGSWFKPMFVTVDSKWYSGWFCNSQADKAALNADAALEKYETACANDATLQQSRIDAGLDPKASISDFFSNIPIQLIMLVIFLLVLLVFVIVIRHLAKAKKDRKIARAVAKGKVSIIEESTPANVSNAQFEQRGNIDGQMLLLQNNCERLGISIDKILATCNGSPHEANALIMRSAPEQLEEFR